MENIKSIIDELNQENGSNFKMAVLKKYNDNELLKRVLKMTYDKVSFTYGVTMKNVTISDELEGNPQPLEWALDMLESRLATRETTGNDALDLVSLMLSELTEDDAFIVEKILDRDLRINLGRTNINKVFKNLIVKPPYTRCEIGTKKNISKNIDFTKKVYSQKKEDGTFRRALLDAGTVEITSRPGIETKFPLIEAELLSLNVDGYVFIGEMTLRGEKDRTKGNGLINSDTPPHEDILYTIWDMVPVQEYRMTKDEIKAAEKAGTLSHYEDRYDMLCELLENNTSLKNVKLIDTVIVTSLREAYEHFQALTKDGFEGTIIKAHDMTHKDGTSRKQLKIKLQFEIDVRITGFIEGKKGTKREATFGSITYETDDGKIKGSVSGFNDKQLEDFNLRRNELIGQIMEVEANDLSKGRNNEHYALSHPRFITLRTKNSTDTLERALKSLENAKSLS